MSPCSSDYIFPFGLGARGRVIVSSPPSRYTFCTPGAFALHVQLGSGLTYIVYMLRFKCSPEFTQFSLRPIMRKGKTFTCEHCQSDFYRQPSYIKSGKSCRFCSMDCYKNSGALKQTQQAPRPKRKNGTTTSCKVCGKDIYRKASDRKRGVGVTCSIECRHKWLSGDKNHFYGQFPENLPKRIQATKQQRLEFLGTECARCGSTKRLELDQIEPRKGYTLGNVQTLCRSCNQRKCWHEDRLYYKGELGG